MGKTGWRREEVVCECVSHRGTENERLCMLARQDGGIERGRDRDRDERERENVHSQNIKNCRVCMWLVGLNVASW
jgi:hypothetical protein